MNQRPGMFSSWGKAIQSLLFIIACSLIAWSGVAYAAMQGVRYMHRHTHFSGGLISLVVIALLVLVFLKILKWLAE